MNHLAPIALFVYNRPEHTHQTIEALRNNAEAKYSDLYIFSDAAKNDAATEAVDKVRNYIKQISGFNSVKIIHRTYNLGLAKSVSDGVTYLCNEFGKAIVLEDDLIVSSHFLDFMNQALDRYEKNEEVSAISGYMYPVNFKTREDTIFLDFPMSWGWATWQRAWKSYNPDGQHLLDQLCLRGKENQFDKNGPPGCLKMLKDQIAGKNNSWFIRWYASIFLESKIVLCPIKSLVLNIGIDGTGVHCGKWIIDPFKIDLSQKKLEVKNIKTQVSEEKRIIRHFFVKVFLLRYLNAFARLFSFKR